MDIKLDTREINQKKQLFQDYSPNSEEIVTVEQAQKALTLLEKNNGRLDTTFDTLLKEEMWNEKTNILTFFGKEKSLWQVTQRVLRQEVCGDEGFRSKISDYNKNPASASLLTGAIVYLVGLTTFPINPAIATIIVLYIVKVGLNIFCEYTEPVDD